VPRPRRHPAPPGIKKEFKEYEEYKERLIRARSAKIAVSQRIWLAKSSERVSRRGFLNS
jgi:hypothetical protein